MSRPPPPPTLPLAQTRPDTACLLLFLSWVFPPILLDYLQTFSFRWITWWSEMWHFDVIPCVIQPQLCNEKPTNNNNNAETIFYFGWFLPAPRQPVVVRLLAPNIGCKKSWLSCQSWWLTAIAGSLNMVQTPTQLRTIGSQQDGPSYWRPSTVNVKLPSCVLCASHS